MSRPPDEASREALGVAWNQRKTSAPRRAERIRRRDALVVVVFALAIVLSVLSAGIAIADPPMQEQVEDSESADPVELPEDHFPPPPVGVRLAEALPAGALRVAYTFERLQYREVLVGGSDRSPGEILGSFYQKTPVELDIDIHTLSLAYAPHERVTLVFEVPFLEKDLQRLTPDGARLVRLKDETDGVGDIAFSLVVPFIRKSNESSQLHISVEAPTGSIRRSSSGETRRLPYDNQIGNGTWDLEWGWTYRGELDRFSWGGQIYGHHPVGTNGLHYREGSRYEASAWSAMRFFRRLSVSLRLGIEKQNNIRGRDRDLDLVEDGPSANDKARGGFRVDIYPGLTLDLPELNHQRLAVEFGVPVYQDLDGPQISRDWSVKAGWQWVF